MRTLILLLLIFSLPAPYAFADIFNETDESYYARQHKSCEYKKKRTTVYDLFAAFRPVYVDECCAQSVEAMREDGARWIHPDKSCPDGMLKQSLTCETSKDWCVRAP